MTDNVFEISQRMMQQARCIICRLGIEEAWKSVGAAPGRFGANGIAYEAS